MQKAKWYKVYDFTGLNDLTDEQKMKVVGLVKKIATYVIVQFRKKNEIWYKSFCDYSSHDFLDNETIFISGMLQAVRHWDEV